MIPKKIISILPLVGGVVCILIALGGVGMQLLNEKKPEKVRSQKPRAAKPAPGVIQEKRPKAVEKSAAELKQQAEAEEELKRQAEAENRREVTRILLERIRKTSRELSLEWFGQVCQYIGDKAALRSYLGDLLTLGEPREAAYEAAQRSSKTVTTSDPRYFISLARGIIYGRHTRKSLEKECKGNLAIALLRENRAKEGLENIDGTFMISLFKELLAMYQLLYQLEEEEGKSPKAWRLEKQKALEAVSIDCFLRIQRREERIRQRKEGTQVSAAPELQRTDLSTKFFNEMLLQLGKLYLEITRSEIQDEKMRRFNAEHAFAVLAMVYQRTQSGEALMAIREVNEIQQNYLHRMGRANWKRAKLAVADQDGQRVDEYYFQATHYYLEAMVKSVGVKKDEVAAEFLQLKQEIATWRTESGGSSTTERAEM